MLKIQVGKRYLTRDGKVATVVRWSVEPGTIYPYVGNIDGDKTTWTAAGRYLFINSEMPNDLVSELPDAPQPPPDLISEAPENSGEKNVRNVENTVREPEKPQPQDEQAFWAQALLFQHSHPISPSERLAFADHMLAAYRERFTTPS